MNARHSRIGLKMAGPTIGTNGKSNALVEVDFAGGLGGLFFAGIFLPRVSAKAVGLGLVAAYGTNLILAYGDVVGLHFVHKPHVLLYGAIGLAVSVGSSLLFSWVFPETDRRKIVGLTYKQSSRGKTC